MKIHYFQRYKSKENVDTANTMLMLSRLYNYNSDKFFRMLNDLILEEDEPPELTFNLQSHNKTSIPDAVISQKSFKIIVETKLYNQFDKKQLINHIEGFKAEDIKILLTLDPKPMSDKLKEEVDSEIKAYNAKNDLETPIKHVNITFEHLVEAMKEIVDERDIEIIDILDDFEKYCFDEKLIPDGYKWMRAVTAGTTFDDNIELGLYYHGTADNYGEQGYIGLYKNKSIRAIGKVYKIIGSEIHEDEVIYKAIKGDEPTDEELDRIEKATLLADEYGYHLNESNHLFYMVEKFYNTDYKKVSKYPIQNSKLFNMEEILQCKQLPETHKIASVLKDMTWE